MKINVLYEIPFPLQADMASVSECLSSYVHQGAMACGAKLKFEGNLNQNVKKDTFKFNCPFMGKFVDIERLLSSH